MIYYGNAQFLEKQEVVSPIFLPRSVLFCDLHRGQTYHGMLVFGFSGLDDCKYIDKPREKNGIRTVFHWTEKN